MDTTLRDGEQTSGVSFNAREKLSIARLLLEELCVSRIEIASARVSQGEQVEALTRLTDAGVVATLPVKLQEVAVARLLQPELSLSELAETFDPPLTKSCLNHRMRKLMELAGKEKA